MTEVELEQVRNEARLNLIEYFDQVPTNESMDWKGWLADARAIVRSDLGLPCEGGDATGSGS